MDRYLRPTAAIAETGLLTADPAGAMALAVELTGTPLMANHAHGLWGYHGATGTGAELSVHSTGIGGQGAALILAELAEHGLRCAVRIDNYLPAAAGSGTLVVSSAEGRDGLSRALGGGVRLHPDEQLTGALAGELGASARVGPILSTEPFHDSGAPSGDRDLASAASLAAATAHGVRLAIALIPVSSSAEQALLETGRAAARALAALQPAPTG